MPFSLSITCSHTNMTNYQRLNGHLSGQVFAVNFKKRIAVTSNFVRKEEVIIADKVIEIVVDVTDKTGGKVKGLQNQLKELDQTAQRLANRFKSFATMKYRAAIELIDRVTEPGNRINNLLRRLAGKAWRLSLSVTDSALGKLRQVESLLMRIASKTYNIAVNVKDNVKGKLGGLMNGAAMGAGMFMPIAGMAGVGFGVANAVQAYAGFEQQMSKVQAITQLKKDSDEMKRLTQQAKDLGASTAWTRQQVGEAQYYQALAGWSTNQILQSTPHLLNLASAGGIDLGRTSDIVTDSMTAFGLKAEETYTNKQGKVVNAVEHFADMLAKMQAISNTDISQAGEAFKYSANVIGAMFSGQSIQNRMQATEDAMIMTGLMANAGIKGSMAGTATRAVFSRMSSMNRNSYNALRAMGVEYKDEGGNILMPGEIMRNLSRRFKEGIDPNQLVNFAEEIAGEKIHADTRRKLDSLIEQTTKNGGKMGSADMAKMASMLAGQEAMSGLLAVLMGDWDAMAEKMDNVNGTAADMANTMLENLAGSFTILGSAWDAFQQDLLEGTAGQGLRGFVDTLTELITRANKLFSDGIDIGDFGKIIGDVIGRLKNKFLELDGIGSVLAGGALAAGLMKIITLSQRALNGIRNVGRATIAGAATGARGTTGGLSAAQKVGTMTVSAGVVNVNGKVNGGGLGGGGGGGGGRRKRPRKVGDQAIIDDYKSVKEYIRGPNPGAPTVVPPPVPSRFAGFGSAAAGGAAFAGIFGLLDIMSMKSANADRLAAATSETERVQIAKENRQAEWEAGAGITGSVLGAAIGAGLGSFVGPLGTAIGGMVGGMIGQYIGTELGRTGAENEIHGESNYYGIKETSGNAGSVQESIWAGFGKEPPGTEQAHRRMVGAYHSLGESATKLNNTVKQMEFFEAVNAKHGVYSPFKFGGGSVAAPELYQARNLTAGGEVKPLDTSGLQAGFDSVLKTMAAFVPSAPLTDLFLGGGKAHANELNEEQMAQMAQMERGEFYPTESPKGLTESTDMPSTDMTSITEQLYSDVEALQEGIGELFSGLGDSITENLTAAFEGVGEVFTSLSDSITEGLTSTFEGASEFFSGFGESIMEGLSSISEGAGEIFSGLGEMISSGMEAANSAATGALEGIQSAFMSAKESIQSAWGELPGFFSGVFSGLGGAAEAAGSAIYSGLTAVIGSIIGAWQSAASTISGIISSIASAGANIGATVSGVIASVTAHAEGGFITSPEFALIGEKGAELILPLTDRERSLELLNQASGILGLNSEQGSGLSPSSSISQGSSSGESLSVGGVTINATFNVDGSGNPQDVMQTIQENLESVVDKIAANLASKVDNCFRNQALNV